MSSFDPHAARRFAEEVVRTLRARGHEALWAGGCVRDRLLGREPKDYDIATSALPEQVREIFGRQRTLAIGAQFGVISVRGPRRAGQIEVATFRRDAEYSDGRHPDSVSFSDARHDAQRRDFTINGLFFDPLEERVIDYVGGEEDLRAGVVRAIGEPAQRFGEDKLRMLRAVRFAATFDFQLDEGTLAAIQAHAEELIIVSAERIAAELRRMLAHPNRAEAGRLLAVSRLMEVVLPESRSLAAPLKTLAETADFPPSDGSAWGITLGVLSALGEASFPAALAALLREVAPQRQRGRLVKTIAERWRLANDESERTAWLLEHEPLARQAASAPWPRVQRALIAPGAGELVQLAEAVARTTHGDLTGVAFCRQKLSLPRETLNPAPLITGDDLKAAGMRPGPAFRTTLEAVRDAQLAGQIHTREEALEFARRRMSGE